jgi:hypothetical protein
LETSQYSRQKSQEGAKQCQIPHSTQNREPETLKLKVVFSLETGIIDTDGFSFRIEGSQTAVINT